MAEYIEREALLKDIEESVVFTVRDGRPSAEIRGANKIIDRIKSAPVTDVVEVRHGRWRVRKAIIFDDELIGYNCSECNTTWDTDTIYCPNCGAKMDGKEVDGE